MFSKKLMVSAVALVFLTAAGAQAAALSGPPSKGKGPTGIGTPAQAGITKPSGRAGAVGHPKAGGGFSNPQAAKETPKPSGN